MMDGLTPARKYGKPCAKHPELNGLRNKASSACIGCARIATKLYPGAPVSSNRRKELSEYHKQQNPQKYLFESALYRAKARSIPFSIDLEDVKIPTHCPVLGIPLSFFGHKNNIPTLDKVHPMLGYVKGNVCVISFRANRIKTDATLDELLQVTAYVQQHSLPTVDCPAGWTDGPKWVVDVDACSGPLVQSAGQIRGCFEDVCKWIQRYPYSVGTFYIRSINEADANDIRRSFPSRDIRRI